MTTATIQNVGPVQTSGVPPLGEGLPPSTGREGDGAAVVTQIGGWSSGPGAVRWHGGQWIMPYSAHPGATLANASCDVVPRTDATALVELVSSNGQILGSSTVPATTANVVIRAWVVLTGHVLLDGEQVVMRVSPRDAATGAWTSAAQDMTVLSCSVNAGLLAPTTVNIPVTAFQFSAGFGLNTSSVTTATTGGVGFPVHSVPVGALITALRAKIKDTNGATITLGLSSKEMPGLAVPVWAIKGTTATSAGNGTVQLLTAAPNYTVPTSTELAVTLQANGVSVNPLTTYIVELDFQ